MGHRSEIHKCASALSAYVQTSHSAATPCRIPVDDVHNSEELEAWLDNVGCKLVGSELIFDGTQEELKERWKHVSEERKDDEEEVVCCICLEDLRKESRLPVTLPCNHQFCFLCIKGVVLSARATCPLCRRDIDPDVLHNVTVHINKFQTQHDAQAPQWAYHGNRFGVWLFDDATNSLLELQYQQYLTHINSPQQTNLADKRPRSTSTRNSRSTRRRLNDEEEQHQEEEEEEESEEFRLFPIFVGNLKFNVDFKDMVQYRCDNPQIRRGVIRDTRKALLERTDLKGIAGVVFDKKTSD